MRIQIKEVKIKDLKHFREPARKESVSLDDYEGDYFTGGFLDGKIYGCNGFRLLNNNNTIIYHSTFLTPETREISGLWTSIFCGRIYLQKKILGEHSDTKILGTIPYRNVNTTIKFLKSIGWKDDCDVFTHTTPHNWVGKAIRLRVSYGELCKEIIPHVKRIETMFDLNFSKEFGVEI